jgi:hypothetical protein
MTDTESEHKRENIEREKNGEWVSTVTDADLIAAVQEHSPAATSEVADDIDMTRVGAHKRLNKLLDAEHSRGLQKKKIGASVVWFVSDESDSDTNTNTESKSESESKEPGSMPTVEDGLNPDAVREDVVNE